MEREGQNPQEYRPFPENVSSKRKAKRLGRPAKRSKTPLFTRKAGFSCKEVLDMVLISGEQKQFRLLKKQAVRRFYPHHTGFLFKNIPRREF